MVMDIKVTVLGAAAWCCLAVWSESKLSTWSTVYGKMMCGLDVPGAASHCSRSKASGVEISFCVGFQVPSAGIFAQTEPPQLTV